MQKILPPEKLVEKNEAAVLATLTDVRLHGELHNDYGNGRLLVERTLYGPHVVGDVLDLRWHNKYVCPRIDHQLHEGQLALWFLKASHDATVEADPYVVRLDKRSLELNWHVWWEEKLFYPDDRVRIVARFIRQALSTATQ